MKFNSILSTLLILLVTLSFVACGDKDSCTDCIKEAAGTGDDCSIEICDNSFSTNGAAACSGVETLLNATSSKQTRISALEGVGYSCN